MKLKLVNVRLAFPQLFNATSFEEGQAKSFSAAFLFGPKHPAKKLIEDACIEVAKEKWGAKWEEQYNKLEKADKLAIHDGDKKSEYDGYEGNYFVNARNKAKPTVRDADGKTDLAEQDGKPYAGCYVNAMIEIYAQDNKFGKRVNATLRGVQFYRDGDAFSGSAPAGDEDFDDLESGEGEDGLM
jgi:hypothetical protein